MWI
ncbi:hypothetical protein LEMLEM_LOCUS23825 [Lemmus lemmus]|jgi:hypothetical protein